MDQKRVEDEVTQILVDSVTMLDSVSFRTVSQDSVLELLTFSLSGCKNHVDGCLAS